MERRNTRRQPILVPRSLPQTIGPPQLLYSIPGHLLSDWTGRLIISRLYHCDILVTYDLQRVQRDNVTVEAASARYAARDRFAFPGEPANTPLQRYIRVSHSCSL